MIFVLPAVVLTLVLLVRIRHEPRRLSNGLLAVATLAAWFVAVSTLLNRMDVRAEAIILVAMMAAILVSVIGLVGAAAVNGLVVIEREGLRPATALPLALSVATVAGLGLLVGTGVVLESHSIPLWLLAAIWTMVLFSVCLGVQLAAFSVYALIYGHLEPDDGAASVVVLGCGLGVGGSVTPLLASRLNRGLEVYEAELTAGRRPALVVSGGQGSDEAVAEGTAMKSYLVDKGVADEDVLAETKSRNTLENLVFSRELLTTEGAQPEPMLVVTSNFHVLRTAAFTRDLGLDAYVTGASTAHFYAPTAFLREFVAVVRRYWKPNVALLFGILAVVLLLQNVD
ncbi:MAG: YdcF family protein [Rhodococcus sp. (in: high G+C Gram-positive bacteria)]|uniref:YdcF family protein n=1 Tax=Rhodococcus sp. TaxID=1831 RepID=UPI002ADC4C28|nr:YdcF family protein [Rhodococcus sp. (in: high G+C Gram-positive bacteria)]MDZ7931646.1 YdcF family protein [Rhodococcus sp. (in: high G+C Gram-positive bacteria)]